MYAEQNFCIHPPTPPLKPADINIQDITPLTEGVVANCLFVILFGFKFQKSKRHNDKHCTTNTKGISKGPYKDGNIIYDEFFLPPPPKPSVPASMTHPKRPKKVKVSYQITKRDNEFPPTLQPELTSHDKVHKGTNEINFQKCKTEVWLFGLTALRCYRKRTCARNTHNILHAN